MPLTGFLCPRAIKRASITSCFSILSFIDQPIIFLENRSRITAKYSQPSRVQIYVISATQDMFADATSKARFKQLSYTGKWWLESVVALNFLLCLAWIPFCLINLATRFFPHR